MTAADQHQSALSGEHAVEQARELGRLRLAADKRRAFGRRRWLGFGAATGLASRRYWSRLASVSP